MACIFTGQVTKAIDQSHSCEAVVELITNIIYIL
jgi:hypothetical protein